jgi:hypothetical protein
LAAIPALLFGAMRFADMSGHADLGRLDAERRKEERVAALAGDSSHS